MKKSLFYIFIIAAFHSQLSFGQTKENLVDELLNISGISSEIKQFDAIFESKIYEKKANFSDQKNYSIFSDAMKKSFNSNKTKFYFNQYLIDNASADSLVKIIEMFKDPLMQKMNKMEKKSSNPGNQKEIIQFFKDLKSNPPSQKRVQSLMVLSEELKTAELTELLLKNIFRSIMIGANKTVNVGERISDKEIDLAMNNLFPAGFDESLKNQLLQISIYTYKDANDEELLTYIIYWQEPILKYYQSLIINAFDSSFSKMAEDLGVEVAKSFD